MGRLIAAAVAALVVPVLLLAAAAAGIVGTDGTGESAAAPGGQPGASSHGVADIPTTMLFLYQRAATADCDGLPWTVLAAVGKLESDHSRSTLPGVHSGANSARAQGPMQ